MDMFQDFSAPGEGADQAGRLAAVRQVLKKSGVQACLQPRSDIHQGEYVPHCDERLAWLTGFTGSAGSCCVTEDKAALFVDGRYTLQAAQQADPALFDIESVENSGSVRWIGETLPEGSRVGFDADLLTVSAVRRMRSRLSESGIELVPLPENPVDLAWENRPGRPATPVLSHPAEYAGETAEAKIAHLKNRMREKRADYLVLTLPDSVCWLLNIRGRDIPHTPVKLCFAVLSANGPLSLYISAEGTDDAVLDDLWSAARILPYASFQDDLGTLGEEGASVWVDPASVPFSAAETIRNSGRAIIEARDPCVALKAAKNAAELEGMRQAHRRDTLAMCRFLKAFEETMSGDGLDEIGAAKLLEKHRRAAGQAAGFPLLDLSFDTISGAGPNGAIVHYRVNEATNRDIGRDELYLVDSGAQFPDGTTDITRTLIAGEPTAGMKEHYTRVLKGHIALSLARFPKGTSGGQLDILARQYLWEAGLDFAHGTGHGVGACLSVHEGPQRIAKRLSDEPLVPGMILSNEPGFYKEGAYGIRIENLLVVREMPFDGSEADAWLGFETLTFVPYCEKLILGELLTERERQYLEFYHNNIVNILITQGAEAELVNWLDHA